MSGDNIDDRDEPIEPVSIDETNELSEYFKSQVDREALRENLKLTPAQRMEKFERMMREKYPDQISPVTPRPQETHVLREDSPPYGGEDAPRDATNDLVEAFKKDVDRTLLIENLKLTPTQRMRQFVQFMDMIYEVRRAGREMRENKARHVS